MRPRLRLYPAIVAAACACAAPTTREQPQERQPGPQEQQQQSPGVTLLTDSTQYTVRFEDGMYRARIGYVYTNRSGDAVSADHCHTPPPPVLEKRVGGTWVRVYSPVMLMCLTLPPFRIADGATHRGVLDLAAAPRGRNIAPALEVDSIPGTYRLRWPLRSGNDPQAPGARTVDATSNAFRLVER